MRRRVLSAKVVSGAHRMMPPVNCRCSGWASMALFYFCLACLLWLPLAEPPLSAQHASSSGNQPQPQAQTPQPAPVRPSCAPAAGPGTLAGRNRIARPSARSPAKKPLPPAA